MVTGPVVLSTYSGLKKPTVPGSRSVVTVAVLRDVAGVEAGTDDVGVGGFS